MFDDFRASSAAKESRARLRRLRGRSRLHLRHLRRGNRRRIGDRAPDCRRKGDAGDIPAAPPEPAPPPPPTAETPQPKANPRPRVKRPELGAAGQDLRREAQGVRQATGRSGRERAPGRPSGRYTGRHGHGCRRTAASSSHPATTEGRAARRTGRRGTQREASVLGGREAQGHRRNGRRRLRRTRGRQRGQPTDPERSSGAARMRPQNGPLVALFSGTAGHRTSSLPYEEVHRFSPGG